MTRFRKTDFRAFVSSTLCCVLVVALTLPAFADFTYYADRTTTKPAPSTSDESQTEPTTASEELAKLQEQYDKLEEKIQEGEQSLNDVEQGKKEQSKNINIIQSNIQDLDGQIEVLEKRVTVLNKDINKLNSSITVLNSEISRLNTSISETEDKLFETQRKTDILYGKIRGRLLINYMNGPATNLEVLVGTRDLPEFFTKLEIILKLSEYDEKILSDFESNLNELNNLNTALSADRSALNTKESALSDEKASLSDRQSDMESSQYVLDLKKELSEHKYEQAVEYFKTLDTTSSDYNAMLTLLSKEQDKVDAQINAYLLKYGSSADDALQENVTQVHEESESTTQDTTTTTRKNTAVITAVTGTAAPKTTTTTATTDAVTSEITFPSTTGKIVTPESMELIWPLPYKNCYISAYYGQYPSGGEHHGLDICVRGGTEGKNVVAAADGTVISYGFNHWSMGNYIIIDHGNGLFTAYYHMQKLFAEKGDHVTQGQVIGLAGHTGNTTGPHLHFEVRISRGGSIIRMNPLKFVKLPG